MLEGKIAELYHPEMFSEHEEVIVFTREEFNRTFTSIKRQIDHLTLVSLHLDRDEEWKLIGYWPKIMQGVHRIDHNLDLIYKKEPLQSYLDAYIYDILQESGDMVAVSEREAVSKPKPCTLDQFY